MVTPELTYQQLKDLYERKMISNDDFEASVKKLVIKGSQAGIIGDHGTIMGDVHIHSSDKTRLHPDNHDVKQTVKIFLASSSELKQDREQFEIFIGRKNKDLNKENIFLQLEIWEDFLDAMSRTRLQDEYNKAIKECDVFVMLFFTKVGQYTEEEFETAFKKFKKTNRPLIYTYFEDADISMGSLNEQDIMSLFAFKKKLNSLGHFYTTYKNIEDLKYQFDQQIDKFLKEIRPVQTDLPPAPTPTPEQQPEHHDGLDEEIQSYCKNAEEIHKAISLIGFKTRLRVPISIEDIYVPLRAMMDLRDTGHTCFGDSEEAEKHLKDCGKGREISLVDAFHEIQTLGLRGIVILGDPGSGKTTHLKRLLLWCLREGLKNLGLPTDMIPVFLPLRELQNLTGGLDDFIQEQLNHHHLKTPPGFGQAMLKRKNLLLLFDGLDEVADVKDRMAVSRWIEEALVLYPDCRFVVTCRFAGYTDKVQLNAHFLEMHIRPLDQEQVRAFIHNWYKIVESGFRSDKEQAGMIAEEEARKLINRLKQPEFRARRVFELTRNPLLLTNICLVHRDRGGNLPKGRAKLYEECTDVLLELWRDTISFQRRIDAVKGRRVLQPAALWLHQEDGRTRATADELSPVIAPALKSIGWQDGTPKDFLETVRNESGILTGWDQENYGFMHLGFQEYLAAKEIGNQAYEDKKVLAELAMHFGESWWQEVILILLAFGEPSHFKPFMAEVVKLPVFAENSNLIEMCLDDAAEVTIQPFIDLVREPAGADRESHERHFTALQVIKRLDPAEIENLIPIIQNHPYDKIRNWLKQQTDQKQQDVVYAKQGGYELVRIPAGYFKMGSEEYDDEKPIHEVHLSEFYLGRYPVTNEEYERYMAANPDVPEPEYWGDRKFNQPKQPVVGVTWHDAQAYAAWAGLRLPSETEWEYACRAGTTSRYYTGDTEKDLDRAGWYIKNSDDQLHPVGEKEPNAFGLYDMHGNVWEWVEDDYHGSYKNAPSDGNAWIYKTRGIFRVLRGGSWYLTAERCRSARRHDGPPVNRLINVGFRLARSQVSNSQASK